MAEKRAGIEKLQFSQNNSNVFGYPRSCQFFLDGKLVCRKSGFAVTEIKSYQHMDWIILHLRIHACLGIHICVQNHGGGYNRYLLFLWNKAKRLLVPYVFVMLIWVAPISEYFFRWDLADLIKKYILCINPSQLWFLWMLFDVFAIVWPLRRVMIEKPLVGWTIAIAFYGLGIIGGKFVPNVFCIWTVRQYILFFFIGIRIRVKSENQERLITEIVPWYCWLIADLVLFIGNTFARQQSGFAWRITTFGMSFLLHIVGAIMAWTVLQTLAPHIRWQDSKVFHTLSSYSMAMYLFHQQIIYFTISALNGMVNPWINAGVNFVAAIAGSLIISAVLMRWKVTRFLIGEKV